MDWKKTKTILIIILLVLNIIMAVMLYQEKIMTKPYTINKNSIEQAKVALENFGIEVKTEIPKKTESLSGLTVMYEEYNPKKINDKYFDRRAKVKKQQDFINLTLDFESITIINNRRILYENIEKMENKKIEKEEALKSAEKFLEKIGFLKDDMILKSVIEDEDRFVFRFTKIYNDIIIEKSYTDIEVKSGVVTRLDRLWINVIEENKGKIEIEPAYKSAYSLLKNNELKGKTLIKIEQCYHFNPEEQGILEDNTRAERGRAIPSWRFEFEEGDFVVVDNY